MKNLLGALLLITAITGVGIAEKTKTTPVTSQVVLIAGEQGTFIFPVVGSVQGGGGTFFRTDLMIVNNGPTSQRVVLGFAPRGNTRGDAGMINREVQIDANSFRSFRDVVSTVFNTSGLGSIIAFGLSPTGTVQFNARLDASARVYTQQPGSTGTVSQSISPVSIASTKGTRSACGPGLRQDPAFRTNVGIFNFGASQRTFRIDARGTEGSVSTTVTVAPLSLEQVPLPAGDLGDLLICVTPDANTPADHVWTSYATSVDNVTGDSWATLLAQCLTPC